MQPYQRERFLGSGSKVLLNVVGGHIGVFEGNSGDLRIGLPMQSLHDGTTWMHSPLRLCVVIAAQQAAISAIVNKHSVVRDLVCNDWLTLFQIDRASGHLFRYQAGAWQRVEDARARL